MKIGDFVLDENSTFEAIEKLRSQSRLTIGVDWETLNADAIDLKTPVSLRLHDADARGALSAIFRNERSKIIYLTEGNSINISTDNRQLVAHIYDIQDLYKTLHEWTPPSDASNLLPDDRFGFWTEEAKFESLIYRETSGYWDSANGRGGSIRWLGDKLIIVQTPRVHRQIESLLMQVRKSFDSGK